MEAVHIVHIVHKNAKLFFTRKIENFGKKYARSCVERVCATYSQKHALKRVYLLSSWLKTHKELF